MESDVTVEKGKKTAVPVPLLVGILVGTLAVVGLAVLGAAVIYKKRSTINYEKVPLLPDQ